MPLDSALLKRLQNPDPAVRRQAIIEIGRVAGQTADASAMPILREVFQTDPDPALRELARKAGLHVRDQLAKSGVGTSAHAGNISPPASRNVTPPPADPITSPDGENAERRAAAYPSIPDDSMFEEVSANAVAPNTSITQPAAIVNAARPLSSVDVWSEEPDLESLTGRRVFTGGRSRPAANAPSSAATSTASASRPAAKPGTSDTEALVLASLGVVGGSPVVDDPDIDLILKAANTGYIPPENRYASSRESVREADLPADKEFADSEAQDTYSGPVRGRKYNVPKENIPRAQGYVEQALSQNVGGQNDRAMKSLSQALNLNPNLVNDQYFMNVAASVTGLDGDGAIRMIVDSQQRSTFVKSQEQRRKTERVRKQLETARANDWNAMAFELAIFALIALVGTIALFLILQQAAGQLSGMLQGLESGRTSALVNENLQSLAEFARLPFGLFIGLTLVSTIGQVLSILLQGAFIHLGARLLGFVGTYTHLMTLTLRAYNRWLPILLAIVGVTIYLAVITLGSPIIACLGIVLIGVLFYSIFKIITAIGQAYDKGTGVGCALLLVSSLILSIIGFLFTSVLGAIFGRVLSSALSG